MNPNPKKPLLTVLLTATFLLAVTACGNPTQPATEAPVTAEPGDVPTVTAADVASCVNDEPHPIGKSISETYDVTYEQVMTWFCSGYSFENILIALETSAAVDVPAETLLEMLLEKGWEEIWVEVGFMDNP